MISECLLYISFLLRTTVTRGRLSCKGNNLFIKVTLKVHELEKLNGSFCADNVLDQLLCNNVCGQCTSS